MNDTELKKVDKDGDESDDGSFYYTADVDAKISALTAQLDAARRERDEAVASEGRAIEFCVGLSGHPIDRLRERLKQGDLATSERDALRAELEAVRTAQRERQRHLDEVYRDNTEQHP